MASTNVVKIGRPAVEDQKKELAKLLWKIKNVQNFKVTHYMKSKLKDAGYVTTELEEAMGPGRRRERVVLTGQGQSLLNISKNWGIDFAA